MVRIILILLLLMSVAFCNKKKDTTEFDNKEMSQNEGQKSESLKNVTQGTFEGTNEDGDYSLFLFSGNDGEIESFIYTADSILENSASYEGKKLSVEWRNDTFEEAGSGETFDAKLLLGVKILD